MLDQKIERLARQMVELANKEAAEALAIEIKIIGGEAAKLGGYGGSQHQVAVLKRCCDALIAQTRKAWALTEEVLSAHNVGRSSALANDTKVMLFEMMNPYKEGMASTFYSKFDKKNPFCYKVIDIAERLDYIFSSVITEINAKIDLYVARQRQDTNYASNIHVENMIGNIQTGSASSAYMLTSNTTPKTQSVTAFDKIRGWIAKLADWISVAKKVFG